MEVPETQQSGSPEPVQATETSVGADGASESPSVSRVEAEEPRRVVGLRRKLSDEQEREVTRLYAETTTPAPEIARRFGIGESSVYRVAQRRGAPLRGRSPTRAQPVQQVSAVSTPLEARQASPPPLAKPTARQAPAAAGRRPTGSISPAKRKAVGGGGRRFRIRFQAEAVLEATDVRDALRQAEARGITEITAVSRED